MQLKRYLFYTLLLFFITITWRCGTEETHKVLVFSKTEGFRHGSIEAGIEAIKKLGVLHNFLVDNTENADFFNEEILQQYRAVIFLNTTGDVLNNQQQNEFERFIQAGGGYVGIHSATDTEYDWKWYGDLVGAYFVSHPMNPNVQKGKFKIVDKNHIATDSLPEYWERNDEFYNFKDISKNIKPLITIDETSYTGGTNGENHPMSWYQEYDGGRVFYTNMGHTSESFSEPLFLKHLLGGIQYAMDEKDVKPLDYDLAKSVRIPNENRFTKVILAENLNEPMEFVPFKNGNVLFIERLGKIRMYDHATQTIKEIATIPVSHVYKNKDGNNPEAEDGLLGVILDPYYEENHWIYLYYSPLGREEKNILTRYEFWNDSLKIETKKVLLEVPVQREQCCHTGGSMAFDEKGNLYLSTGDNTSPRATNYAPLDDRKGRTPWDAQKGSSNTNDLRGKIIRIHPEPDGTYTIPDGNLFEKNTEKTRPEIYIMGTRNPFRIDYDAKTGFLYWGDVGPDAGKDSAGLGPKAYDEINQARNPGFFGWPYFVGNNFAYHNFDFTKNKATEIFNYEKPINNSKNNTGMNTLPPAQPAFIWYPYDGSIEFKELGTGGRSAMAGPVFYSDDFKNATRPFPSYYDKKLFIYEWMRGWIMAVTMDEQGNYKAMERFMPSYKFSNPIDMKFGYDGDLYVLEYGTGWFQANDDARIVRIEYNGGNRKPQAIAKVDKNRGAIPLTCTFSTEAYDLDYDELIYEWNISLANTHIKRLTGKNAVFTFDKVGVYNVALSVRDNKGGESIENMEVIVGTGTNEPPKLSIHIVNGNQSFFIPGQSFDYEVKVEDKEDGSTADGKIATDNVLVSIDYISEPTKEEQKQGHQSSEDFTRIGNGKKLLTESDCQTCHQWNKKIVGPTFKDIVNKYKNDKNAVDYLSDKIIKGGNGVWGEINMAAHPQLNKENAILIVKYIMSLSDVNYDKKNLPIKGTYYVSEQIKQGTVVIRASYTDKGYKDMPPLSTQTELSLTLPQIAPHNANNKEGVEIFKIPGQDTKIAIISKSDAYLQFNNVDITNINAITIMTSAPIDMMNASGGIIEVHIDSPTGDTIGKSSFIKPTEGPIMSLKPQVVSIPIRTIKGSKDLFFVFKNETAETGKPLLICFMIIYNTTNTDSIK
ncbi:MAG: ThuA domain-containing protein [Chitinophagaceae bacterium]|nr:ThuA domain-containing protein [Chitinophagaceae bacterium]